MCLEKKSGVRIKNPNHPKVYSTLCNSLGPFKLILVAIIVRHFSSSKSNTKNAFSRLNENVSVSQSHWVKNKFTWVTKSRIFYLFVTFWFYPCRLFTIIFLFICLKIKYKFIFCYQSKVKVHFN